MDPSTFAHRSAAVKHVTIVGVNYAPEPSGTAPFTAALAEALAERGITVEVHTGMPHYPSWVVDQDYAKSPVMREVRRGVFVTRYNHYTPKNPNIFNRLHYELSFTRRLIRPLWRNQADVTLSVVPGLFPSLALTAIKLLRRRNSHSIIWIQDMISRAAEETAGRVGTLASKLIVALERWIIGHADQIVVISTEFERRVLESGAEPAKVQIVANWNFMPRASGTRDALRKRFGWADAELVLLHAGNMGLKQGLEAFIDAARWSAHGQPQTRFVLVGGGNQESFLRDAALGLKNVEFVGSVDDQTYSDMTSAADVLVVTERRGVREMSLPSKLAAYKASGLPILAYVYPQGGTARALTNYAKSLIIDHYEEPATLARAARSLALSGTRPDTADQGNRDQSSDSLSDLVDLVTGGGTLRSGT